MISVIKVLRRRQIEKCVWTRTNDNAYTVDMTEILRHYLIGVDKVVKEDKERKKALCLLYIRILPLRGDGIVATKRSCRLRQEEQRLLFDDFPYRAICYLSFWRSYNVRLLLRQHFPHRWLGKNAKLVRNQRSSPRNLPGDVFVGELHPPGEGWGLSFVGVINEWS